MLHQFWIAYLTILRREILRFARIWVQTIIPPVVMVALYFIIFGNLIGQRIGEMDGMVYIDFIMPGLVMMSIITNSYTNVVSSFYGAKYSHHIEEMQIAPVPDLVILLGFVTGGMARGICVGAAVTLVSLLFTDFQHLQPLVVVILVALLTSCLFSLAGLINAIFANSFDDITIIPTFRADSPDLPGRHLLLDQAAARILADGFARQSRFCTWSTVFVTAFAAVATSNSPRHCW